ncbi:MAG: ECF transporter S component [Clostridia bacterium]|nr:ECF transporter S component [Clostridia bacterium]
MKRYRFLSAKNIATLGVLLALVLVLQLALGTITIGQVQLNFSLIPIVLGAILLGPIAGAILGLACGIIVLVQLVAVPTLFNTTLWTYNPVVTTFICLLKTTVAGGVAGILFKLIAKKNELVATFVAAGIVPIINTGLFILGCLCMSGTIGIFRDELSAIAGFENFAGMNVFIFILVGIVTFNFFLEFAINLVLAPALHRVVLITEKQVRAKIAKKDDEPVPETDGQGEVQEEPQEQQEQTEQKDI